MPPAHKIWQGTLAARGPPGVARRAYQDSLRAPLFVAVYGMNAREPVFDKFVAECGMHGSPYLTMFEAVYGIYAQEPSLNSFIQIGPHELSYT